MPQGQTRAERSGKGWAMAVLVTLDVFSGRPDPNWSLTAVQEAELTRRLAVLPTVARRPQQDEPLGYRGFRVQLHAKGNHASELRVFNGYIVGPRRINVDRGRALELWLLNTGQTSISSDLAAYISGEIAAVP
jgi:hypothetical protein